MPDNSQITNGTGDLIASDLITDGGVANGVKAQRVKAGFGADGNYSDVAPDSGLPTAGGYKELTGSASANNTDLIASTDVRAYRWLSIQATGTFTATVTVQCSNDGVTWYQSPLQVAIGWSAGSATGYNATLNAVGVWNGPIVARYLRVRTTSYSSGTVTAVVELTQHIGPQPPYLGADSSGNLKVLPATGTRALGDARNTNQWDTEAAAGLMVYNGTTWDRVRSVVAGHGTTGTGVPGAGLLAWDGTGSIYRRVAVDTVGVLQVNESQAGTAALTSVASSASTGSLVAARTLRKGLVIVNESTANLYVAYAATASLTAYSYKVAAAATLEMPQPVYNGAVSGIWDAANGNARITELY